MPPRAPSEQLSRSRCGDRKSTRLNSSHSQISYAVFCLKKKKYDNLIRQQTAPLHLLMHTLHSTSATLILYYAAHILHKYNHKNVRSPTHYSAAPDTTD